jgi:hypothetical protein
MLKILKWFSFLALCKNHEGVFIFARHYAASRVRILMRSLDFFQFSQSFQPQYDPGVDSASNRNEYQEYSFWSKARPERKADSLNRICEPIV